MKRDKKRLITFLSSFTLSILTTFRNFRSVSSAYHAGLTAEDWAICRYVILVTTHTKLLFTFTAIFMQQFFHVHDFLIHLAQFVAQLANLPQKLLNYVTLIVDFYCLLVDFARVSMLQLGDVVNKLGKFLTRRIHFDCGWVFMFRSNSLFTPMLQVWLAISSVIHWIRFDVCVYWGERNEYFQTLSLLSVDNSRDWVN